MVRKDLRKVKPGEPIDDKWRACVRLRPDAPSRAITTQAHCLVHPTEDRFITIEEASKIQGFPENFLFIGSKTRKWRAIGEAVPPPLAKAIAERIKKRLIEDSFA